SEMAQRGEADTRQVHRARVDAVRERDEDRYRHGVRGVEEAGDPARLAVADLPVANEAGKERGPRVGADLGAHLGDADEGDETGRGHAARPAARSPGVPAATASRRRSYQRDIISIASHAVEQLTSSDTRPAFQPQWSTIHANAVGEAELMMSTGVAMTP